MKIKYIVTGALLLAALSSGAQNYPHYTMFMFNKLVYNPGYAGSRDVTSVNATYRNQWSGLQGAPKSFNVNVDGPVGSYMKPFRPVALGLGISNEAVGVTNTTNINLYYAYRIPVQKTVLSLGLQAGASLYSVDANKLNVFQQGDLVLNQSINNRFLPNVGAGAYWSGNSFYVGLAVPNLLENYYDRDRKSVTKDGGKQIRSYYLSGGYVFSLSDAVKLQPQAIIRYAANGESSLPLNSDINLACILYDRLMIGATYRTDKSVQGIVHLQATRYINLGYSYGFSNSGLANYNSGTHEIVLGIDFMRDNNKYVNPRFVRSF